MGQEEGQEPRLYLSLVSPRPLWEASKEIWKERGKTRLSDITVPATESWQETTDTVNQYRKVRDYLSFTKAHCKKNKYSVVRICPFCNSCCYHRSISPTCSKKAAFILTFHVSADGSSLPLCLHLCFYCNRCLLGEGCGERVEKASSLWGATGYLGYSNCYNCCATEKSFYYDLLILPSN